MFDPLTTFSSEGFSHRDNLLKPNL